MLPLTVQTAVLCDVRVTGNPDEADGFRTTVGLCIDWVPGFGSVIVCGAFVTLNERVIAAATR